MKKLIHLLSLGLLTGSCLYHTSMTMKHDENYEKEGETLDQYAKKSEKLENYKKEDDENENIDDILHFNDIQEALSILSVQENERVKYAYDELKKPFASESKSKYMTKAHSKKELEKIENAYKTMKQYNLANKTPKAIQDSLYLKALSLLNSNKNDSFEKITENYNSLLEEDPSDIMPNIAYNIVKKLFEKIQKASPLRKKFTTEANKKLLEQGEQLNKLLKEPIFFNQALEISLNILDSKTSIHDFDINALQRPYLNFVEQYKSGELNDQEFYIIKEAYDFLLRAAKKIKSFQKKESDDKLLKQGEEFQKLLKYRINFTKAKKIALDILGIISTENVLDFNKIEDAYINNKELYQSNFLGKKQFEIIYNAYNFLINQTPSQTSYMTTASSEDSIVHPVYQIPKELQILGLPAHSTWPEVEHQYHYLSAVENDLNKLRKITQAYDYLKKHLLPEYQEYLASASTRKIV